MARLHLEDGAVVYLLRLDVVLEELLLLGEHLVVDLVSGELLLDEVVEELLPLGGYLEVHIPGEILLDASKQDQLLHTLPFLDRPPLVAGRLLPEYLTVIPCGRYRYIQRASSGPSWNSKGRPSSDYYIGCPISRLLKAKISLSGLDEDGLDL